MQTVQSQHGQSHAQRPLSFSPLAVKVTSLARLLYREVTTSGARLLYGELWALAVAAVLDSLGHRVARLTQSTRLHLGHAQLGLKE